jgi:hypothetical protein
VNTEQRSILHRLRSARWVNQRPPLPSPPPPAETREAELARLRERLHLLTASDRSVRAWVFVSPETRARKLAENAKARAAVEARIGELAGGTRTRSVHPL